MTDNKKAPKVSIIVPVYNVEKYLHRCLDSVAAQTFTNWECILVDDGSPDASGKICDEYAEKDPRFRVIHKANGGVSSARNVGLDAAEGDWISFVDADDWIEISMIEELYDFAKEKDADVVISGDARVRNEKIVETHIPPTGIMSMPKDFAIYWQGPWAKLFKSTVLPNIRFPDGISLAEDLLFTFKIFFTSEKIYGLSVAGYNYFINPVSAVNTITYKKIEDELKVLKTIEEILDKNHADKEWYAFLENRKILCKNKYIFRLEIPDYKLWKNTYPELSRKIIKKGNLLQKLYYLCAYYDLKKIANIMFNLKHGQKK